MRLRNDPLEIFRSSRTPPGLYARQKWLGEGNTGSWKIDFRETVDQIMAGQAPEGSWGGSVVMTVQRLFGLHLTLRENSKQIEKGITWLIERSVACYPRSRFNQKKTLTSQALRGLPFTRGCSGLFLYGVTLFLSTIFNMKQTGRLIHMYEWLNDLGVGKKGRWCGRSCSNNILRAFVVHPVYSRSPAVNLHIKLLSSRQNISGSWPDGVPFYETVNALAHLETVDSDTQLEKAFKRLYETQNSDGTWGRSDTEWKTFLVVHALKNKEEFQ